MRLRVAQALSEETRQRFLPMAARTGRSVRDQIRGRRMGTATAADPCRVLLVDDEDTFVELLRTMLESDGRFEVLGRARNGKEAVELAVALAPDAILMDIDMPVMDGVEATVRIRRSRPEIPVVVVSGFDYSERAAKARLAGAVRCVRKTRIGPDLVDALLAAQTP